MTSRLMQGAVTLVTAMDESLRDGERLCICGINCCRLCTVWLFEHSSAPGSRRMAQIHATRAIYGGRSLPQPQNVSTHATLAGRSRSHQSCRAGGGGRVALRIQALGES